MLAMYVDQTRLRQEETKFILGDEARENRRNLGGSKVQRLASTIRSNQNVPVQHHKKGSAERNTNTLHNQCQLSKS